MWWGCFQKQPEFFYEKTVLRRPWVAYRSRSHLLRGFRQHLHYQPVWLNSFGAAVGPFGAEDLTAAPFGVSGTLLWMSTSPVPGAESRYVLSSSKRQPCSMLRLLCNGNCSTVNRMTEDLLQKHWE